MNAPLLMLVMLVGMCKGRARCASFNLLFIANLGRERFIAAAEDPEIPGLVTLLPQASVGLSNSLHVFHSSIVASASSPT